MGGRIITNILTANYGQCQPTEPMVALLALADSFSKLTLLDYCPIIKPH